MAYCPECAASLPAGAASCLTCGAQLLDTPTLVEMAARPAIDVARLTDDLGASLAPRYELLRQLGEGGMGLVFLAREPALKRLVAVKLLAPDLAGDASARSRFEREARAAAALSHPNVVRVYAVGETAGLKLPYIVMQFVEGATLAEVMEERGRLSEREARRIIGEVAAALAAAHGRDLVHRDVKPSNVLVEKGTRRAYVADFGVSAALAPADRAGQTKLTATGMMIGTPVYMSPEQASAGEVGPASDVYSLGVLSYELLTGEPPFKATTPMGWAAAHLRDTPTPVATRRDDVSPEIALLVDRCLAKEPGRRPTAEEVARGMLPSLETELAWPPPGLAGLWARTRPLSWLALTSVSASLAVVLLVALPPEAALPGANWLQRFAAYGSDDSSFAEVDQAVLQQADGTLFAWQGGLLLAGLVALAALVALMVGCDRAFASALRNRGRGWRWSTLLDLAADRDGRSGLLLSGAREFASLTGASRKAILTCRRAALGSQLAAALWVGLVLIVHLVGLVGGLGVTQAGALLGPGWATMALLPALVLLIGAAAARFLERSLMGPLARRREFALDPAEVAAWYAQAPGGTAPSSLAVGRARFTRIAGITAAAFVIGLGFGAIAVAVGSSYLAARNVRWTGPETARFITSVAEFRAARPSALLASLTRSGALILEPASDSQTRAWLTTLRLARDGHFPPAEWMRLLSLDFPVRNYGVASGDLFRRAYEGRLGRDTLRALEELGTVEAVALYRRLARAQRLNLIAAAFDRPVDEFATRDSIPRLAGVGGLALRNVMAAIGQIARRDLDGAEQRLRENTRFAQVLANTPVFEWNYAAYHVRRWSYGPMAAVARLRGEHARADSIDALLRADYSVSGSPIGLAADPDNLSPLGDVLADTLLTPRMRAVSFWRSWAAFCLNAREIAFGPSPRRAAGMVALADRMRDVPHAAEFARLDARDWHRARERGTLRGLWFRANACGPWFRYQ